MAKSQYICRADSAHFPPSSLTLQGRFDVTTSGRMQRLMHIAREVLQPRKVVSGLPRIGGGDFRQQARKLAHQMRRPLLNHRRSIS